MEGKKLAARKSKSPILKKQVL